MLRALRARSPAPAASAILLNQGKVLLVKRRYEPYQGYWSLPGGHVEHGESSLEAAIRELLEETGVQPDIQGVAGIAELIGTSNHYIIIVYWGFARGEPRASDDAEDARWVPYHQLPNLPLTPSTRHMLQEWSPGRYVHVVCAYGVCKTILKLECGDAALGARLG